MAGDNSLSAFVNASLRTSAWDILQVLLFCSQGPVSVMSSPHHLSRKISLASFLNPRAQIHAFKPTMGLSACFPCLFSCAVPGSLSPSQECWTFLQAFISLCWPHHRAQPHFPEPSPSAHPSPCSPSLNNPHWKVWGLLRVGKEDSSDDHLLLSYSTSL